MKERVQALLARGGRVLLGLAGPPGAGKSTLAARLHEAFAGQSVVVPMDGFHLPQAELRRLGREQRKGAPDTFDAEGFVALLQRLRAGDADVRAPAFHRAAEEPQADAIVVPKDTPLVIVEGNYLLLDTPPWHRVRPLLDECWFVGGDPQERVRRLIARHVEHGRSEAAAREWVMRSDEANARQVLACAGRADLVVSA